MNKGKYILLECGKEFKVRTFVGNTYFTYENDENSFFEIGDNFSSNASGLRVDFKLIET